MSRFAVLFAVVPITVLLTASFFVLLGGEKAASAGLKKFAKVVAILLWVSAGVVCVGAVSRLCCGPMMGGHPMMMNHGMGGMHGKMCPMGAQGGMKMPEGCCAKTNK
ncbi:MAG: hypothetical protein J0L75_07895 [Spirochaetes bacterium]|nr:hypothetical protein [Spirochaetota bacterium]